jgi:hypothetical protein
MLIKKINEENGFDLNPGFWSIQDASFLIKLCVCKGVWDEE